MAVIRRSFLLASLCGATACREAPAGMSEQLKAGLMQEAEPRMTLETLAQRMSIAAPTLRGVAEVFGAPWQAGQTDVKVLWNSPPFSEISIDEFEMTINVSVKLTEKAWKLGDIAADPSAFTLAPRLPDSGALEAGRTWETSQSYITWIVRLVEAEGPLASRHVSGKLRCQVSPR